MSFRYRLNTSPPRTSTGLMSSSRPARTSRLTWAHSVSTGKAKYTGERRSRACPVIEAFERWKNCCRLLEKTRKLEVWCSTSRGTNAKSTGHLSNEIKCDEFRGRAPSALFDTLSYHRTIIVLLFQVHQNIVCPSGRTIEESRGDYITGSRILLA